MTNGDCIEDYCHNSWQALILDSICQPFSKKFVSAVFLVFFLRFDFIPITLSLLSFKLAILKNKWRESAKSDNHVNIHPDLSCFALDTITHVCVGKKLGTQTSVEGHEYYRAMHILNQEIVLRAAFGKN